MLLCPQCQFTNPNTHNFCQQCGAALTHIACPECQTQVPLDRLNCPQCGTQTGKVWLALVSGHALAATVTTDHLVGAMATPDSVASAVDRMDASAEETLPPRISDELDPIGLPSSAESSPINSDDSLESQPQNLQEWVVGDYLDPQQRYQLIEPLSAIAPGETATVKVLDCQPLQISPLTALKQSHADPEEAKMDAFIIPAAQAYFSLQLTAKGQFPQLQDAWEQGQQTVILLESYDDLPHWSDQLKNPELSIQQLIHELQSITELWQILTPLNCCSSLLDPDNLYRHPNQIIGVQRLYFDSAGAEIKLAQLGQLWQQLLQDCQRTLLGSLMELLQDLIEGKIDTLDGLQTRLNQISTEIEPDSPAPSGITQLQVDEADSSASGTHPAPTKPRLLPLVQLEAVGGTDVGRQRQHNEDAFGVQTLLNYQQTHGGQTLDAKGLYVLCDGMGGHAAGEVASQLAVETLRQHFHSQWVGELPTADLIRAAILQTNHVIYGLNQQQVRSGAGRMGTTLVMAVVADNRVGIAHVGDSRLYRLTSQQGLEQLTIDHEVGQRSIQQGIAPDIAYSNPDAYQLTQALGPRDHEYVKPDIQFVDITEDTLLILASDGLTDNHLLETYQSTYLDPYLNSGANLKTGVQGLIDLANQRNGHDNISVILVRAQVASP